MVAVAGGSAGGHLAALAALTGDRRELQPGFEDADTSVQACVPIYGVYDPPNELGHQYPGLRDFLARVVLKADPGGASRAVADRVPARRRSTPGRPPFLVVHGDRDTLTSPQEAAAFVANLRETSRAPVGLIQLPGAQHAFDMFPSIRTAHLVLGVARFLEVTHQRTAGATTDAGAQPSRRGSGVAMKRIAGKDAVFLWAETPSTHMTIAFVGIFDPSTTPGGAAGAGRAVTRASSSCSRSASTSCRSSGSGWRTCRSGLDNPYFVDDPDFDIGYHLRRIALPEPGDRHLLQEFVGRLVSRPLDMTKPLWEIYVVEGLADGCWAYVGKAHHVLVDGVGGNEMLVQLLDLEPEPREVEPPDEPWSPAPLPSDLDLLRNAAVGTALQARAVRPDAATVGRRGPGLRPVGDPARRRRPRPQRARPAHVPQRAHPPAPPGLPRQDPPRRRQARQERARLHGQRRRARHHGARAAPLRQRARRDVSTRAWSPPCRSRSVRGVTPRPPRQPGLGDDRAAARRRGRRGRAAAPDLAGHQAGQGAARGGGRHAAAGLVRVRPARRRGPGHALLLAARDWPGATRRSPT